MPTPREIRPWDGNLETASAVLTAGFADHAVPQAETPADVQRQIDVGYIDPAFSMIAWAGGVAVGGVFAALRGDHRARIHSMGVAPEHRRQGFGRLLLEAVINELESAGAKEIRLEVLEANAGARALYDGAGFRASRLLHCLRLQQVGDRARQPDTRRGGVELLQDLPAPTVEPPLHRDREALRRMKGVEVAITSGAARAWMAWRGSIVLELGGALDRHLGDLFAVLPAGPAKIIDVPEGDPLAALLLGEGWTEYARQREMVKLAG